MKRLALVSAVTLALIMVVFFWGGLTLGNAYAQDMNIWIGKWFKITEKVKGYHGTDSGVSTWREAFIQYWNFIGWDEVNKVLLIRSYEFDSEDGEWDQWDTSLSYIAGSNLNFLCWYQQTFMGDIERWSDGFTAYIKGRTKDNVLKSATFTTLGGYEYDYDERMPDSMKSFAGSLTISGKLIPISKLPPDIP